MLWKFAEVIALGSVKEIKYWIYGQFKMHPSDAYTLDLKILVDMIIAHSRVKEEEFDEKMSILAWQTSLLMTATGNYKKGIKPKDLYTSIFDKKEDAKVNNAVDIDTLRQQLLDTFSDSITQG